MCLHVFVVHVRQPVAEGLIRLRVRMGQCKLGNHFYSVAVSKLYYTQPGQGKSQHVQLLLDLLRVTVSVCLCVSG